MPIILQKRLSRPFYKKLSAQANFGALTACQIVTDAVGSVKEISDNFSNFSYVNYFVPVGVFAETTVYHQNIEGGAGRIKLTSEKGYLSYCFRQALDFHLAKDPYSSKWTSENSLTQSPGEEQTSLDIPPVEKEPGLESQTVDQDPDLDADFLTTQESAGQIPNGQQGVVVGPDLKRLKEEEQPSIFSDDELFLLDRYYRLNQYILNFPELVFSLEGVLEQKKEALTRVKQRKAQENSPQYDKTIGTLEREIEKLVTKISNKETLNGEIVALKKQITKLRGLESIVKEKIRKLETKISNQETLNDEIAHLENKIRKKKLKSLQDSLSLTAKKIHNLAKQISLLENSIQTLEREALYEERHMAEKRLICLENYLEQSYFERIAQVKEQKSGEGSHLTEQQLRQLTTLINEGKRKILYLRLALALSIFLAVTGSVAIYYVSLIVFSSLAFLGPLLPYIMVALAIVAAIGTAFLVYNTLADIILGDKWPNLDAIWNWFSRGENESRGKHVFRVIAAIVAITISFAAVAAVGYTIYAQLLPILGPTASVFAMLPCLLSECIFIMKNSFDSIRMLKGDFNIGGQFKTFFLGLKTQMATENPLQWSLHLIRIPFQFVLLIFKFTVFILHVVMTAVSADQLPYVPPFIVMIISGLSELLTDFSQLFSKKDDEAEHDHDHSGGPLGHLRNLFFLIPALVLGCLNYLFSQLNRFDPDPKKEYLSFKEAINQELIAFEIKHSHKEEERQYVNKMLENLTPKLMNGSMSATSESVNRSHSTPTTSEPVNNSSSSMPATPLLAADSMTQDAEKENKLKLRIALFPIQLVAQPLEEEIKRLKSKNSESTKPKIDFFSKKLAIITDETMKDSCKIEAMSDSGLCLEKHRSFFRFPYQKTTSAKRWHEIQELSQRSDCDSTSLRYSGLSR